MPPTKRKPEESESDPSQPATAPSVRLTRAAAKGATSKLSAPPVPEKKTKKGKGAGKGKQKKKEEEEEAVKHDEGEEKVVEEGDSAKIVGAASNKTIIIERCTQCKSFKDRATLVKEALEERVSGITVLENPVKPRRGCFEIREEAGQKFISLLDMKRPFKPMKDLNMDKVISDIIDKIK